MQFTLYTPSDFDQTQSALSSLSLHEKEYLSERLFEFLSTIRHILNNRLQPSSFKTGKNLFLGSCPFLILNWFLTKQNPIKRVRCIPKIRDGIRVCTRRHYYTWKNSLPNLAGGGQWYMRYHGSGNENYTSECRSFYISLTIIVYEEDDRVFANFEQVAQTKWTQDNSILWFDVN